MTAVTVLLKNKVRGKGHMTMALATALSKPRAYHYNFGVRIGKNSKKGCT